MFIRGERVDTHDVHTHIRMVSELPSVISGKSSQSKFIERCPDSDVHAHVRQAAHMRETWVECGDPAYLGQAILNYKKASALAFRRGDRYHANLYAVFYANTASKRGNFERRTANYLDKLISVSRPDAPDLGYITLLSYQYHIIVDYLSSEAGLDDPCADQYREKLPDIRDELKAHYPSVFAEVKDTEAYGVEQNEVGYSDFERVGASRLHSCIGVFAHDYLTRRTSVTHVDHSTTEASLVGMLKRLPRRSDGERPIDIKLIGARYYNKTKDNPESLSRQNIEKVLRALSDQHVDIVAADLFLEHQLTTAVIDPATGGIVEAVPARFSPNNVLAYSTAFLTSSRRDLGLAFDLTESKERQPVLFTASHVNRLLSSFKNRVPVQVFNWFKMTQGRFSADNVYSTAIVPEVLDAHANAYQHIIAELEPTVQKLVQNGVSLNCQGRTAWISTIQSSPLFVGQGSAEANRPFIDFLKEEAAETAKRYGRVGIDREKAHSFSHTAPSP